MLRVLLITSSGFIRRLLYRIKVLMSKNPIFSFKSAFFMALLNILVILSIIEVGKPTKKYVSVTIFRDY